MSGKTQGRAHPVSFSFDVCIEGKPVVRNFDLFTLNDHNTGPFPIMQPQGAPPVAVRVDEVEIEQPVELCEWCGKERHAFDRKGRVGSNLGSSAVLGRNMLEGRELSTHSWYAGPFSLAAHHLICLEVLDDDGWASFCSQFGYHPDRRPNGVFTAALLGCPGAQVMPRSEDVCPKATRIAMEETFTASRWQGRGTVDIQQPDEHAARGGTGRLGVFRDGEVVGRIEGREYNGTLVYGRLQTVEKDGRLFLVGRYTRAKFPDGTEIPVCLHLGNYALNPVAEGSKRGAILYDRVDVFEAVTIWP